jgi:hypothetical protein
MTATLIQFAPRPPVVGVPATITRPTPLFDEHGRQLRVVAPGVTCWITAIYRWNPGPGSPERERAIVRFGLTDHTYDVDRGSLWVDEVTP